MRQIIFITSTAVIIGLSYYLIYTLSFPIFTLLAQYTSSTITKVIHTLTLFYLYHKTSKILIPKIETLTRPETIRKREILQNLSSELPAIQSFQALKNHVFPLIKETINPYEITLIPTNQVTSSHESPQKFKLPLISNKELIGELTVTPFKKTDQKFLKDFASQLATPLKNVLLLDELKENYETLKKAQAKLIESEKEKALTEEREKNIRELSYLITEKIKKTLTKIDANITQIETQKNPSFELYNTIQKKCIKLSKFTKEFLENEKKKLKL